jgi:hypothetical protein
MKNRNLLAVLVTLCLATFTFAQAAGTIAVSWNPVTTNADGSPITDLSGYYVHLGTVSVPNTTAPPAGYTIKSSLVTGTSFTIPNLTDCTMYYVAVSAVDTSGSYSTKYSNEITGYPRVTLTAVAPSVLLRGVTTTLTLTGTNFQAGAITSPNTGITFGTPTVTACGTATVQATVATAAALGTTDIEFKRTVDSVYGTGVGLITIAQDTSIPSSPTNAIRTDKK